MDLDLETFEIARQRAAAHLLAQRNDAGHWEGRLSSSALSTATAITALTLIDRAHNTLAHAGLIRVGARWLIEHQNADGGWGDTDRSFSNISTTTLGWAALALVGHQLDQPDAERSRIAATLAGQWLSEQAGSLDPTDLAKAITARYGKDRTFSVPIITMSVLCGRFGEGADAWRHVVQLPFELAAFPQRWYRYLKLPVVSYALPALIAMGHVKHRNRPTLNPIARAVRWLTGRRTLRVLEQIQPSNGGFLEATPLTSFVTMSLAGAGLANHPVAKQGVAFIVDSVRPDGSWPIDTNLATWCTTLSVNALAAGGKLDEHLDAEAQKPIRKWLFGQQYRKTHRYTAAPPGGWAWTDLPGGVPDADDTSSALVALAHLSPRSERVTGDQRLAAEAALGWLEGLQNRDGGVPTFCRGWGTLPFDRSCADITAHALRACGRWTFSSSAGRLAREGQRFLEDTQQKDGSWRPLWFGNQHQVTEENPTYGTSRVVLGLLGRNKDAHQRAAGGIGYLLAQQNEDGGWGGERGTPSTIEETALALEAVAAALHTLGEEVLGDEAEGALARGTNWLMERTEAGTRFDASPIGFYFAKLWYYESLYPVVWTVAAFERVGAYLASRKVAPTLRVAGEIGH
ncbi:MAG: prenyltransferase/squalene oxidase repeat-containing protein [Phycisphaeraceae bacterium]